MRRSDDGVLLHVGAAHLRRCVRSRGRGGHCAISLSLDSHAHPNFTQRRVSRTRGPRNCDRSALPPRELLRCVPAGRLRGRKHLCGIPRLAREKVHRPLSRRRVSAVRGHSGARRCGRASLSRGSLSHARPGFPRAPLTRSRRPQSALSAEEWRTCDRVAKRHDTGGVDPEDGTSVSVTYSVSEVLDIQFLLCTLIWVLALLGVFAALRPVGSPLKRALVAFFSNEAPAAAARDSTAPPPLP